jgi:hypothetical protein
MSQPSLSSVSKTNDTEPGASNPIPLLLAMFQKELERAERYHGSEIRVSFGTACMPAYFDCGVSKSGCGSGVHVFKIGQIIMAQINRYKYIMLGVEWDPTTMQVGALEEKVSICCEYTLNSQSERVAKALYETNYPATGEPLKTVPGDWKLQKLEDLFKEVMLTVPSKYRICGIGRYTCALTISLRPAPFTEKRDRLGGREDREDRRISIILHDELIEIRFGQNQAQIICHADSVTREAVTEIQKLLH